jgi:hypothetical protein
VPVKVTATAPVTATATVPVGFETPLLATTRHLTRDLRQNHQSETVNRKWHPDVLAAISFENFSINAPSDGGR